jgi:hypothetical protein
MSDSFIDILLDTSDCIDKGTQAIKLAKHDILTTLGFERGDKNPITREDIESYNNLRNEYSQALQNGSPHCTKVLGDALFIRTIDLIQRCFTSENAGVLFDKLSKRWKM